MSTDADPQRAFPASPVPSDERLWPGEQPFTSWGQHDTGSLDIRVFLQGTWWVDLHQHPHRLTGMRGDYITNVIAFLTEHAEYFHRQMAYWQLLQTAGDLLTGNAPGDLLAQALGAPTITELTPHNWLASTPLMRALRRQQIAHGGPNN